MEGAGRDRVGAVVPATAGRAGHVAAKEVERCEDEGSDNEQHDDDGKVGNLERWSARVKEIWQRWWIRMSGGEGHGRRALMIWSGLGEDVNWYQLGVPVVFVDTCGLTQGFRPLRREAWLARGVYEENSGGRG